MGFMKKKLFAILGLTFFLIFSASISYSEKIEAVLEGKKVFLTKTADNFIIMYDSSSSMDSMYGNTGMSSLEAEREILKEKNATLPNLNWQAGIYTFTPGFSSKSLENITPIQTYNKQVFANAIDNLPAEPKGPTLLQNGLRELENVLAGMTGRTAVFVFTDGQYSHANGVVKPSALAKTIVEKNDVCFYVIDTGAGKKGDDAIKAIASVNECSGTIPFADLLGHPEKLTNALFVVEEIEVVEVVTDKETMIVEEVGDTVIAYEWKNILFDFNKADIRPDDLDDLAVMTTFLIENPNTRLVLAGYADSIGTPEYNLKLSERRAVAVRDFLAKDAGIDKDRITVSGFGEKEPLESNMYKAGRQQNRRVQGYIVPN